MLLWVKYINNGYWVVFISEKLYFVKLCGEGSNIIVIDIIIRFLI